MTVKIPVCSLYANAPFVPADAMKFGAAKPRTTTVSGTVLIIAKAPSGPKLIVLPANEVESMCSNP